MINLLNFIFSNTIDPNIPDQFIWLIGLGIALGLTIVVTIYLEVDTKIFLIIFLLFVAFMTWGGLLEGWIFVTIFTISLLFVGYEILSKRRS